MLLSAFIGGLLVYVWSFYYLLGVGVCLIDDLIT